MLETAFNLERLESRYNQVETKTKEENLSRGHWPELCVWLRLFGFELLNCRKEPSWATFIVPNLVRQSKSPLLMGPQRDPLKRKPNVKELMLILRKDQSLWKSYEKAY